MPSSMTVSKMAVLTMVFIVSPSVFATVQRTFVSVLGNDTHPCSVIQPCRNFAAAIAQTTSGGEVIAVDSGGFGPFVVDRGISIIAAPGVYAGVTVFSGDGIVLNSLGLPVTLRNLTITGLGGANGIVDADVGQLFVDNCVVSGFTSSGLVYTNDTNYGSANLVSISNSIFRKNQHGVNISATGNFFIHTQIDNSRLEANETGLQIGGDGTNHTTIFQSHLTRNSFALYQSKPVGRSAVTQIESSVISANENGILSDGSGGGQSYVRVSNSTITGNEGAALSASMGGFLWSRLNNTVEGNQLGAFNGTYTAK